jgi:Rieske Fe-S protein
MCDETVAPSVESEVFTPRRTFLGLLGAGFVAVVAWPWRKAQAKKVAVGLGKLEALQKVGGSTTVKIKDKEVLLVRSSETAVCALNPQCTHKKCTVAFKQETGKIHCKCHKSAFALDGTVEGGPAPKPLQVYPAQLDGERIIIDFPEEAGVPG